MLDGSKWFPALGIAGGAILAGVGAGVALAAFATGGLEDRPFPHESQSITAFLGNPDAREADFLASAEAEDGPPYYAVHCKGCGPGIQERMWNRHAYDVGGEIAPPEEYAPYEYQSPYGSDTAFNAAEPLLEPAYRTQEQPQEMVLHNDDGLNKPVATIEPDTMARVGPIQRNMRESIIREKAADRIEEISAALQYGG